MVVAEQLECRSTCRNRVAAPTTAHPHSRTDLTTFPERDVSTWITWRGGALRRRGPDRSRGDRTSPMRLDGTMTTDPASGPAVGELLRLRSEEHTSELQSRFDLVCRLLLEKENT